MKKLFRKIRFYFLTKSVEKRLKNCKGVVGLCHCLEGKDFRFRFRFSDFINANYEFDMYLFPLWPENIPKRMEVLKAFLATELDRDFTDMHVSTALVPVEQINKVRDYLK